MLGLALLAILGLAALVVATRPRRTSESPSRQTVHRDLGPSAFLSRVPTGREVERQATATRRPAESVVVPEEPHGVERLVPADAAAIGVSRRQFFNRSLVGMMGLARTGFGGSVLAFLWPRPSGAFGSKVSAGTIDDLAQRIDEARQPAYLAQARTYISRYPRESLAEARTSYSSAVVPGMEAGFIALYQKCPHLGCRVPFCATSQWFECPCHGSQYTRVGEKKGGPAPRGMDLFPIAIDGNTVTVDTGVVIQGMPIGTDISGQEAEGPHCVSARSEYIRRGRSTRRRAQ